MPTIETDAPIPKLSKSLLATRAKFKLLLMQTSFIGRCVDNRRDNRRIIGSSLGVVTEPAHFANAHKNARILATLKMRKEARFRSQLAYGGPAVEQDYTEHKALKDVQRRGNTRALILNVRDTKTVHEIPYGKFTQCFGSSFRRSQSMHGILGLLSGDVEVYGTDDANEDTPFSYIIHRADSFNYDKGPAPFQLNWYWHDTPEELSVDCTAHLNRAYTSTILLA